MHRYCGILSAYGMGLADVVQENEIPLGEEYDRDLVEKIYDNQFKDL
jgi:N-methylhydantoinase A/oxoprolinase/acetone carboxylase beta subunit